MARILFSILLVLVSWANLWADDFDRFKTTTRLFVEAADFYWEERIDGSKVLDEKGALYGIGLAVSDICTASKSINPDLYRLTFGGYLKYTFGTMDYDGQAQRLSEDGQTLEAIPAKTKVDYSGFTFEPYVGALFKTRSLNWFIEPKLALGYRNWTRNLKTTAQAQGYEEHWQTLYGKLGATAIFLFHEAYRLDLSGGAIVPLWAANDVDLVSHISLSPKAFHPTPYADATLQYKRVELTIYFEAFAYGQSDPVNGYVQFGDQIYSAQISQPDSYEERIGARLSIAFY